MKLSSMTLALAVLAMLGVGFVSGCGKDSSSTPATPTTEKAEDAVTPFPGRELAMAVRTVGSRSEGFK